MPSFSVRGGEGGEARREGRYEGSKASLKHSYPEVGEGVALKVKNPFESSPNIIPFLSCFRGIEYFFGHLAHETNDGHSSE